MPLLFGRDSDGLSQCAGSIWLAIRQQRLVQVQVRFHEAWDRHTTFAVDPLVPATTQLWSDGPDEAVVDLNVNDGSARVDDDVPNDQVHYFAW